MAQFPEPFPAVGAPVVRVPASPCVPNNRAKGKADVRLRLVQVVREALAARADLVLPIVRGVNDLALYRQVHVPALVPPAVRQCCRRFPTRCRRRRSLVSPYILASRHNANVPLWTSARWKGSASFTQPASVPVPVGVGLQLPPLLLQSHARRATSP